MVMLFSGETRHQAVSWGLCLLAVALTVAWSKILFMAWGVGIQALSFTGLSGHSALSAAIWPPLLGLFVGHRGHVWRATAALLGLSFAALIGISRLVLHAHSASEVLSGYGLGSAASSILLIRQAEGWQFRRGISWLIFLLVAAVLVGHGARFPSQCMLRYVVALLVKDVPVHAGAAQSLKGE